MGEIEEVGSTIFGTYPVEMGMLAGSTNSQLNKLIVRRGEEMDIYVTRHSPLVVTCLIPNAIRNVKTGECIGFKNVVAVSKVVFIHVRGLSSLENLVLVS